MTSKEVPDTLLFHDPQVEMRAVPRPRLRSRLKFEQDLSERPVPGGAIVLVAGARNHFLVVLGFPAATPLFPAAQSPSGSIW
jgi:hypothetical protein